MQTIIVTSTKKLRQTAQKVGRYEHSTITQALEDVGFIHCTTPPQVMDVVPRFIDVEDIILLLIDVEKVQPEVKYEAAKSGRTGSFPHIYGPLNNNAVYKIIPLKKRKQHLQNSTSNHRANVAK